MLPLLLFLVSSNLQGLSARLSESAITKFAYAAVVQDNDDNVICTGVLIRNDAVLLAAHCLDDMTDLNGIKVVVGKLADGSGQTLAIKSINSHPQYEKDNPRRPNDIAVVFIENVGWSEAVKKNKVLDFQGFIEGEPVKNVGWVKGVPADSPESFQKSSGQGLQTHACEKAGGVFEMDSVTCIEAKERKDDCNEDSRGLLIDGKGKVAGLYSRDPTGCNDGKAVYTRIGFYHHWIKDLMKEPKKDAIFPYTALVQDNGGNAICTGVNIRTDVVLVAAHCLEEALPSGLKVVVGKSGNNPGQILAVKSFISHQEYEKDNPRKPNDIAILFVENAGRSEHKMLDYDGRIEGELVTNIGWLKGVPANSSNFRMSVAKGLQTHECETAHGVFQMDSVACIQAKERKEDCLEEGRGLLIGAKGEVAGLYSRDPTSCNDGKAVYTRIGFYDSWIRRWTDPVGDPATDLELIIFPQVQEYAVRIGKSAALTCKAQIRDSSLVSQFSWTGPNGEVANSSRIFTEENTEEYGVLTSTVFIREFEDSDSGFYTCQLTFLSFDNTPALKTSILVSAFRPLQWVDAPENQSAILGQPHKVKCEVDSLPSPSIKWTKNGARISETLPGTDNYEIQRDGILIRDVTRNDAGVYTCRATVQSTGEMEERVIGLEVFVPPAFTQIVKDLEIVEDDFARFDCTATGEPLPMYTFINPQGVRIEGRPGFVTSPKSGVLVIEEVKREYAGQYRCEATNGGGTIVAKPILNVIAKPKMMCFFNATGGRDSDVAIECLARGGASVESSVVQGANVNLAIFGSLPVFNELYKCVPQFRAKDWGYHGLHNYARWGEIDTNCGSGEEQSPIEIVKEDTIFANFSPLELNGYDRNPESYAIRNNGHTLVMWMPDATNPLARSGGLRSDYQFFQMHIHFGETSDDGSEHAINGKRYPLELHLVHYNKNYSSIADSIGHRDGLEVLGVLVEISEERNPTFDPFVAAVDELVQPDSWKVLPGDSFLLSDLLPKSRDFYRYHGSLTTPSCSQVVYWTVFAETIKISEEQIAVFRKLIDHDLEPMAGNFRPLQKLYGREVFRNFD